MSLRTFIFAALVAVVSTGNHAHAKVLKFATIAPEGSAWMKTMNDAGNEVDRRTSGRVKFKFFTGGVMGNDKAVLRKVKLGQLDGGMFTLGSLAESCPDMRIYGIPFLFPDMAAVDRVRAELDPVLKECLKKGGFTSFGFAEGGVARFYSKEPVDSVDSMRGRKMWVPEGDVIGLAAMESLGLAPTPLPITDVLTGLQTGLIEVAGNSSIGALALQWHTATKYVTTTPLLYVAAVLAVKNASYEEIDAKDRDVVSEVLERVYKGFNKQNRSDEDKAYKTLISEGLTPVDPKPGEVDRWRAVASKLANDMASRGEFSMDLYKRALSLASKGPGTK